MIRDYFCTRFFEMKNVFPQDTLLELLNDIKKDTDYLAALSDALVTKTNFPFRKLHAHKFNGFVAELNVILRDTYNASFEISNGDDIWYQEYGPNAFIEPHQHIGNLQCDIFEPPNIWRYSGLVNITDIGSTTFMNPNFAAFAPHKINIKSEQGDVLLFPSNLWHYTTPHNYQDRVRAVFSFNGTLQMDY